MKQDFKIYLLFFSMAFTSSALSAVCGKIQKIKGSVEVLRIKPSDKNKKNPTRRVILGKKKFKIDCSDVLQTPKRSRVKIRFVNNAVMSMGPSSRIFVSDYVKQTKDVNLINLTYGKVRTFLENENKDKNNNEKNGETQGLKSRLKIKTPGATVGVRGTDFYVSYEPNKKVTEQATLKGSVEVEQLGSGQKVIVEKGEQVKVDKVIDTPAQLEPEVNPNQNRILGVGEALPTKKIKPLEPKKVIPIKKFEPLKVEKIEKEIVEEIKETSSIAKEEEVFTSKEAIAILGAPETWKAPEGDIPEDLKDIKEEF